MTNLHEPVYLRFRGRTRRLPLVAIATALRRDAAGAVQALEILIQGPPENRSSANTSVPTASSAPLARHGEGVGGGVQEQQQQTHMNLSCEQEQRHGDGGVGEGAGPADVDTLVAQLGSDANRVAIERLANLHPRPLLYEALRRTLRIPPERIRSSRSAIFTGIVRKLAAAEPARPPTP
jgi:hypothetical protein